MFLTYSTAGTILQTERDDPASEVDVKIREQN